MKRGYRVQICATEDRNVTDHQYIKNQSQFTVLTVSSGELQERQVKEYLFENKYLQPDIENTAGYKCWTVLFGIMFSL